MMTKIEVNQISKKHAAQEAAEAKSQWGLFAKADANMGREISSADVLRKASLVDMAGFQKIDDAEADAEIKDHG